MAVPRVAILALVGAVLCVGALLATRGSAMPAGSPAAAGSAAPAPAVEVDAERAPRDGVKPEARSVPQVPHGVLGTIADGRVVVLMFSQEGADDRATRRNVERLRATLGGRLRDEFRVVVDDVEHLSDYAPIVSVLGVDRAPATVFVAPRGTAEVVEGYLDGRSLRQHVVDALR